MNNIDMFKEYCNQLNNMCIEKQNNKEVISDIDAFEALVYISIMKLEDYGDYLLFLSSVNLLNTYVKQKDAKISYNFKKNISYLIDISELNKKIIYGYDKQDKNILIIQINNIQFSFHFVDLKYTQHMNNDIKKIKWDGIRKQCCAISIFNSCKKNSLCRCNKTFRGKNLDVKVNKYLDNYKNNKCDFNIKF